MDHCQHCPGPDDPRHEDPAVAQAEAQCAFYEKPENMAIAVPGHQRGRRTAVSLRYEPGSCGPRTFTAASGY